MIQHIITISKQGKFFEVYAQGDFGVRSSFYDFSKRFRALSSARRCAAKLSESTTKQIKKANQKAHVKIIEQL